MAALLGAALLAAALATGCGSARDRDEADFRGELLTSDQVGILSFAELDASLAVTGLSATLGPVACDVAVHRLVHRSAGVLGEPATVSAAMLVPQGERCPGPYPLLAYARGTDDDRDRTLADPSDRETALLAATFATRGYLVVATDYLGYAASDYPLHPYLHPATEASSVLDAIRAARAAAARLGVADNGQVFLAGYSQGGHAVMATHRAIERERPQDIALDASAPMSGPYDLSVNLQAQASALPRWLESALRDAIASRDEPAGVDQAGSPDPAIDPASGSPLAIVTETAGLLRLDDPQALLRSLPALQQALTDNSVADWSPQAPMLMCHGSRDPVVPFEDARRTHAGFVARGATQVRLVDVETLAGASASLPPAGAAGHEALAGYHQRLVPPLCFAIARDELFEPLRR